MALSGGASPVVLATGLQGPASIAIDATNVYFGQSVGGTIKSVPIASTGSTTPTVLASGQNPFGIAVQNGVVYWTNNAGSSANGDAFVMSVAVTGGAMPTTLTQAANATYPVGIAVNETTIFITCNAAQGGPNYVLSMPLAGSESPTVLASNENTPWGIAVDANNVYWTNNETTNGNVSSVPLSGSTTITRYVTNAGGPNGIAVDSVGVYYAASGGGRIWRLSPP
jgi:hypothetical protein